MANKPCEPILTGTAAPDGTALDSVALDSVALGNVAPDNVATDNVATENVARAWAAGDNSLFDVLPVSMWLLDCGALKTLFDTWRAQGVGDLAAWLQGDPKRVLACRRAMRLVKGNRHSRLQGAANARAFLESQSVTAMIPGQASYISGLVKMWNGELNFVAQVNMRLPEGETVDLFTRTVVLPGHETDWAGVLMMADDTSAQQAMRRQLASSEAYARTIFEQSPVALLVEDFSLIKKSLDRLRASGIADLQNYLDANPAFLKSCVADLGIVDINAHTLVLFGAPDKETIGSQISVILGDTALTHFRNVLVFLWQGTLRQQHEVRNYTLSGEPLDLVMQFSVLPGHEDDWSLVLVALTDITARKKAETTLAYLGRHDPLTGLMNRSYYIEEIERLERNGPFPITVIVADLNGLKAVNDSQGHAAGDALLYRTSQVFREALQRPARAGRIGGDEFAILLPGTDAAQGKKIMARIERLVAQNNRQYPDCELSLSMGMATSEVSQLEGTIHHADLRMYEAKRAYYVRFPAASRRAPVSVN